MNTLQKNIKNLLVNSVSGVHSIFYGPKNKNGEYTDEPSLIYFVENKLPLNKIPEDQIIPSRIKIENQYYKTDVVQCSRFRLNQCYSLTDQNVVFLQSRIRPLLGGIEISNLASWGQFTPVNNQPVFSYSVGTLGFLAVDNVDNTLVGVTNNHVIVKDAFLSSEKNALSAVSTIYDPVVFSKVGGYNRTLNPAILQFGSDNGNVNFNNDSIGITKRYVPVSENGNNTVDAALIAINSDVTDFSSAQQAELPGSYAMPFASTTEITSLSTSIIPIYSVGRTTGPKGIACQLKVYDAGYGSTFIEFEKQGVPVAVIMSDIMVYRFANNSNLPIYGGDSGSALIGNFNGTYKIVGLAFAGDTNSDINNPTSTHGLACRIDNIAQQLNISAWDGSTKPFSDTNPDNILKIYRPLSDNRVSITYNGKNYYQAGITKTNTPDTNI
jgi:hypothetical protein